MLRHIHGVVEDAYDNNGTLGVINEVQEEMAGRTAALADMKQAPFRRKSRAVVSEPGILRKSAARLREQRTITRHLGRPKLGARSDENLPDVCPRGVGQDDAHGLLPQRFGFRLVHERLELLIGFELRTVEAKLFHAFVPCGAEQPGALCFNGLALLERFLAREQHLRDRREAAGGNLRFGEAGDFLWDLAGVDGAGHSRFPQ
jgi:hypothetical protein